MRLAYTITFLQRQWKPQTRESVHFFIPTSVGGAQQSRLAVLSFDEDCDTNRISPRLLKDELEIPIEPMDREDDQNTKEAKVSKADFQGHVDIKWAFSGDQSPDTIYSTRFLVTAAPEPTFDAILGRKTMMQYGFAKPARKWK